MSTAFTTPKIYENVCLGFPRQTIHQTQINYRKYKICQENVIDFNVKHKMIAIVEEYTTEMKFYDSKMLWLNR